MEAREEGRNGRRGTGGVITEKVCPTSGHGHSNYSPCNIPVSPSWSDIRPVSQSVSQSQGSRMWSRGWAGLVSGSQQAGSGSSRVVLSAHTNTRLHAARQQRHWSLGRDSSNIPPIHPELIKPFFSLCCPLSLSLSLSLSLPLSPSLSFLILMCAWLMLCVCVCVCVCASASPCAQFPLLLSSLFLSHWSTTANGYSFLLRSNPL